MAYSIICQNVTHTPKTGIGIDSHQRIRRRAQGCGFHINSSYVDGSLSSFVFLWYTIAAAEHTYLPQHARLSAKTGRMLCAIHQSCTFPVRPETPSVRQSAYVISADTPPASFQTVGRRSLFSAIRSHSCSVFSIPTWLTRLIPRCSTNSSPAFNGYDLSATHSVPPAMSDKTGSAGRLHLQKPHRPATGTFPEIAFRPPTRGRTSKVL